MPSSQIFPNGQTLTTSALTEVDVSALMQQVTCFILGITNNLPFSVNLTLGSNQVTLPSIVGVAVGYKISDVGYGFLGYGSGGYGSGGNIPANTIITGIIGNVITMSNVALATVTETVFITDPLAGKSVRQSWPTEGAPAYAITDNVTFVRCTEVDDWYNKVRDEGSDVNDAVSAVKLIEYTRVWRVFWELRGPGAYDRGRLLKSAMQLDFIRDMVAASNLYLVPNVGNPVRAPEFFEGKWWERSDLAMHFNEQVNESIVTPTVASIEVIVEDANGIVLDIQAT